jgi:hypothetical protein
MDGGDKRDTSLLGKGTLHSIVSAVYVVGFLHVLYRACEEAYNIRLYAIKEYGPISTFEDILSVCCFWGVGFFVISAYPFGAVSSLSGRTGYTTHKHLFYLSNAHPNNLCLTFPPSSYSP